MPECPSVPELVEFDDPALANLLFGPRTAHLDMLAKESGAHITSRGASVLVESDDPDVRRALCQVFVQLYALLRGGLVLGEQDITRAYAMVRNDPGLNLGAVFRDAVFVSTPRKTVTARNVAQNA